MAIGTKQLSVFTPSQLSDESYGVKFIGENLKLVLNVRSIFPDIPLTAGVKFEFEESVEDLLQDVQAYEKSSFFGKLRRRLAPRDSEQPIQVQEHKLALVCEEVSKNPAKYQRHKSIVLNQLVEREKRFQLVQQKSKSRTKKTHRGLEAKEVYRYMSHRTKTWFQRAVAYMLEKLAGEKNQLLVVAVAKQEPEVISLESRLRRERSDAKQEFYGLFGSAAIRLKADYSAEGVVFVDELESWIESEQARVRANFTDTKRWLSVSSSQEEKDKVDAHIALLNDNFNQLYVLGKEIFEKAKAEINLFERIRLDLNDLEIEAKKSIGRNPHRGKNSQIKLERLELTRRQIEFKAMQLILSSPASRDLQTTHSVSQTRLMDFFGNTQRRIDKRFVQALGGKKAPAVRESAYKAYRNFLGKMMDLFGLTSSAKVKEAQAQYKADLVNLRPTLAQADFGNFEQHINHADVEATFWQTLLSHHERYKVLLNNAMTLAKFLNLSLSDDRYRQFTAAHAKVLRETLARYESAKGQQTSLSHRVEDLIRQFGDTVKEYSDAVAKGTAIDEYYLQFIRSVQSKVISEPALIPNYVQQVSSELQSFAQQLTQELGVSVQAEKEVQAWDELSKKMVLLQTQAQDHIIPKGEEYSKVNADELQRFKASIQTLLFNEVKACLDKKSDANLVESLQQKLTQALMSFLEVRMSSSNFNDETAIYFLRLKADLERYIQESMIPQICEVVKRVFIFQAEVPVLLVKDMAGGITMWLDRLYKRHTSVGMSKSKMTKQFKQEMPGYDKFFGDVDRELYRPIHRVLDRHAEVMRKYRADKSIIKPPSEMWEFCDWFDEEHSKYQAYFAEQVIDHVEYGATEKEVDRLKTRLKREADIRATGFFDQIYDRLKNESPEVQLSALLYVKEAWHPLTDRLSHSDEDAYVEWMIRLRLYHIGERAYPEGVASDQSLVELFKQFSAKREGFNWEGDKATFTKLLHWQRLRLELYQGSKDELSKMKKTFYFGFHPDRYQHEGTVQEKEQMTRDFNFLMEELNELIESEAPVQTIKDIGRVELDELGPDGQWMLTQLYLVQAERLEKEREELRGKIISAKKAEGAAASPPIISPRDTFFTTEQTNAAPTFPLSKQEEKESSVDAQKFEETVAVGAAIRKGSL